MKTFKITLLLLAAVFSFSYFPADEAQAANCVFYRDLGVGMWGEDVRCLQQYLNTTGLNTYSYLSPDGNFGPATRQAVMNWQSLNGVSVSGYFEATSRARYSQIPTTGYVLGAQTSVYDYNTPVYPTYSPVPSVPFTAEQRAIQRIKDALLMIEDAEDEIDDSRKNTRDAEDLLEDAKDDIFLSLMSLYNDGNYNRAYDQADDAFRNAEDAFDEADGGSRSNKNDIQDWIDDVEDMIADAQDDIDDADDDGEDVRDAEDLLDDARDALDDAEDAFDDKDYDDAEDYLEEAEDLIDEALDEIN